MGINISQFSPPATVSNLVWDADMETGAGKIFKGDLTGNVTGNVVGYTTKVWSVSAGTPIILLSSGASASYSIQRQIYQLPPKETMSGSVKVWFGNGCSPSSVVNLYFLDVDMNVLQAPQITGTETAYNIPAGCNSIYINGFVIYIGPNPDVRLRAMVLS